MELNPGFPFRLPRTQPTEPSVLVKNCDKFNVFMADFENISDFLSRHAV